MEIKDRILLAAVELFMRNGIRSVSMDDIATHLGMSKKTLYKWFENKDQIVLAVMQGRLNKEEVDCEQAFLTGANALEAMFNLVQWHQGMLATIHPSVFHELQKYYPQAWALFEEHKNNFILQKVVANIRRGMEEGLYRPDLDVDVLARLHLAEIELMFNNTVFPPKQFGIQRVNTALVEHFLTGISTLQGHKLINEYRQVTEAE
ncbi:TetR/AcrR family transcriptional regulator [Hymenobacter busanensis]|uniref:TetR/AcrR family transcriptional regulator n=1 Tax=Hymenobacter busanensis TaxID=2607656 RepID=A0A7L4ZZF4_9BACT|nr:TetR/AcrR family transcriptional regulator [Hymenobacter busanensis]KAA9331496.1 TetR/AcrR family transcriptional regulator [Hymenobacter busanensis]QHJ08651.1 TetR family transcriptional regulator [Hymenobacter busanensis]